MRTRADKFYMRCLFCGKELAFLKRLTGGAEFCSDAHRKKYQEQFNDLALSRLLQSYPKSAMEENAPQPAAPEPVEAPTPAFEPQIPSPDDDTPNMAGFLAELPVPYSPGAPEIEGGEPPLLEPCRLFIPSHSDASSEQVREYHLPWAEPVAWRWTKEFRTSHVHPRKTGVEPREFSAETVRPVLQLSAEHGASQSKWSPALAAEPLPQITNQPRLPSGSPPLWSAALRPFALEPADQLREDQLRLDFNIIRLANVAEHRELEPPQSHNEPLPVILRGVSPGLAKSVAVTSSAQSAPIPDSLDSLPLRPAIILKPKPMELSSAAAVPERLVKQRRPEVRIVPVDSAPAPAPTLSTKPAPQPKPHPEAVALPKPVLIPLSPASQLGLPELHAIEDKGIWSRMPMAAKLVLAVVIVASISGFAYLTLTSAHATAKTTPSVPQWETGSQINTNGWIDDWAPADQLRRVTLMRGTENRSNYRLEFTAQIQNKAIGWMFRGLNPKNYYVAKIEKTSDKTNPEPVVAFVRYAVIDGKNEGRVEKILPMKVHVGTPYKIRFDATGSHFAVWVLGEKVDEWEDARLGSGALGLYSEGDEAPAIQGGVNAWELVGTSVAGK